jgi:tetratricopeptide (TPR) repeat protein
MESDQGKVQVVYIKSGEYQSAAVKKVDPEIPPSVDGAWPIVRTLVEVTIDEEGNVVDTLPLIGSSLLAKATQTAALQWKFRPYRISGKSVRVITGIWFDFPDPLEGQQWSSWRGIAQKRLEKSPQSAVALYNMGYVLEMSNSYQEAAEWFKKTISQAPDWALGHYGLGEAYYGMRKYNEALECFQRAIQLQPDYFSAYLHSGWCLVRLQRESEALPVFLKASEVAVKAKDKMAAYQNVSSSYRDLGKPEESVDAGSKIADYAWRIQQVGGIELSSASEEAISVALKYERLGKTERAIEYYRLAIEANPESEAALRARLILAALYRKQGCQTESDVLLNELVALSDAALKRYQAEDADHYISNFYFWRGCAREALEQNQAALEDLKKVIKHNPSWNEPHLHLGYLYQKLGDVKSAINEFRLSQMVDEDFIRRVESQSKPN